MGCGASAGDAKAKKDLEDKFMEATIIEPTGIEDFDSVFEKGDAPLMEIIDTNNVFQAGIEQLMAAGSALSGAYQSAATIKDNKISVEIFKPADKKDGKNITIAVIEGGAKGKGISIKDKALEKSGGLDAEDVKKAMEALDAQIESFNKVVGDKGITVNIKSNRVQPPPKSDKPKDREGILKFQAVVDACNNMNMAYYPLKKELAKAAFKSGFDFKKVVMQIIDKIKEIIKDNLPTVKADMAGIMNGELNFDISMDGANINEFFETSDLIPPMLKDAWMKINGEGGLIDCMKQAAKNAFVLKPKIEEAVTAVQGLPTDPSELKDKATGAGLGTSEPELKSLQEKMKRNVSQLSRTPQVVKDFLENLKARVQELIDCLMSFAKK